MQQETYSYAFQLSQGYRGAGICCHPKNPQFVISTLSKNLQTQKSRLYSLQYDEQNPRKSLLTSREVEGLIKNIYTLNDEFFLANVQKDKGWSIVKFQFSKEDNPQPKAGVEVKTLSEPIVNILQTKGGNLILSSPSQISSLNLEQPDKQQVLISSQRPISYSTIDPIHEYLAYVTDSKQISITDKTCKKDKYTIESKGNQQILNIDFNPNKQYYLMCSYHNSLKFYDIRKGNLPVRCHDDHHSLILNSKYNNSHDELIVTAYDDGTVGLLRVTSVSSVPMAKDEDMLVRLYDQHQDAVYQVIWSSFSPWVFASLGYSATNFVVNVVPSAEKYRILL